jgi:hypothetical protein
MRDRRNAMAVAGVIAALALFGVLVSGCSMSRWAEVEPGEYVALHGSPATHDIAARRTEKLVIDRDRRQILLTFADGSEILTSFVPRERAEWPSGCPSNVNSTRMEVLQIAEDPLTVGATAFSHPILVRDCPTDPARLVLRGDGAIGGGGSACPHPEPCIFFGRQHTASAYPQPLPHSMKGYELYSWKDGQKWFFTLTTGTDRVKSYEEIVSTDSVLTGTGWVKRTVQGTENLESMLSQLPGGETVTWISDRWLERAGAPVGKIQLPGPQVIKEIDGYCRRLAIQLQVAD